MWILASDDLKYFVPQSGRGGGHTSVDIATLGSKNLPRLFNDELSAKLALGHWLAGPYEPNRDECGWYPVQRTDPNRKIEWEAVLAPRKVTLV